MRISYFREFIALSKCLNFSLAAKQLNMTQPGLSRHISALENELGIKLFKRDTHLVKLTENGEIFLSGIQKIVDDYDFLCESVATEGLKKIIIGAPYYGVDRYLSHIIGPFKAVNSNVKIDYLTAYPDEVIAGLFSMQVDVAILPRVEFLNSEKLVFSDAFNEPVVLMLNKNHPLGNKTGVHLRELEYENMVFIKGNWGNALFEHTCAFFDQLGLAPLREKKEADSIEAAALNMKPDNGVMLLPEHIKKKNISGNIKFIKILDETCFLKICLVHHPANQNPIIHKFIRYYLNRTREIPKLG